MMLKAVLLILFTLFLGSCAQITSLNLKKHQFGRMPTQIVWFQVEGFDLEQIAILKSSLSSAQIQTSFENFNCIGNAWEYSLFNLRPGALASSMAQVTGKKSVMNTCEDFKLTPIWKEMFSKGYKVGVFEGEQIQSTSWLKAKTCPDGDAFINGVTFWKMEPPLNDVKQFHADEKNIFTTGTIYYDKSCIKGQCYSSFEKNVLKVFQEFTKNNSNYLMIVRNAQLGKFIEQKNVTKIKDELRGLDNLFKYFNVYSEKHSNFLFIVTSVSPKGTDLPRSGKDWENFEKSAQYKIHTETKLLGPVFASGARAENFCGVYDQTDILNRIFTGPKQQGLDFTIINPFQGGL